MQVATPILTVDPSSLMNIDADEAVRSIFGWFNTDPKLLRKAKDVRAKRVAQAQQEQAAAQIGLAQGGAAAARDAAAGLKDIGAINAA
jgi:hypothetical protein